MCGDNVNLIGKTCWRTTTGAGTKYLVGWLRHHCDTTVMEDTECLTTNIFHADVSIQGHTQSTRLSEEEANCGRLHYAWQDHHCNTECDMATTVPFGKRIRLEQTQIIFGVKRAVLLGTIHIFQFQYGPCCPVRWCYGRKLHGNVANFCGAWCETTTYCSMLSRWIMWRVAMVPALARAIYN